MYFLGILFDLRYGIISADDVWIWKHGKIVTMNFYWNRLFDLGFGIHAIGNL